MQRIVLSYPNKTHTPEDLRALFAEFNRMYSDICARWRHMEENGLVDLDNNLRFVSDPAIAFLKERADYESYDALVSAFSDFRRLMAKDLGF